MSFFDVITHSAASNATMVDSDGLLKWRPHNLLTYSETPASWSNQGSTDVELTDGLPTGISRGWKLVEDTSTNQHNMSIGGSSTVVGGTYRYSGWVKAAERSVVWFYSTSAARGIYFDLSSVTASNAFGGGSATTSGTISDAGNGWYFCQLIVSGVTGTSGQMIVGVSTTAGTISYLGDGASGAYFAGMHLYRSDLGGMVNNPDRGDSYVPTTTSAVYLPRRGHHVYNGDSWVNKGLLHESEARTNLLLNSGTLSTQGVTVTAVPHTLHFTGTGTITLSGASTAGPLIGTGAGENNRVSLTFTPTAGTLTLTVSGTVTNAQLEAGSTPSSYIPTSGATVTRSAETLTVPAANLPWSSSAVSIQMQGEMTYADEDQLFDVEFVKWGEAGNAIRSFVRGLSNTLRFEQSSSNVYDDVAVAQPDQGVNVPFNIASRHGSTFVNGAVGGAALTANTTPTALPDLSATDLQLGYDFNGTISLFRIWADDIGDVGIAEAST